MILDKQQLYNLRNIHQEAHVYMVNHFWLAQCWWLAYNLLTACMWNVIQHGTMLLWDQNTFRKHTWVFSCKQEWKMFVKCTVPMCKSHSRCCICGTPLCIFFILFIFKLDFIILIFTVYWHWKLKMSEDVVLGIRSAIPKVATSCNSYISAVRVLLNNLDYVTVYFLSVIHSSAFRKVLVRQNIE